VSIIVTAINHPHRLFAAVTPWIGTFHKPVAAFKPVGIVVKWPREPSISVAVVVSHNFQIAVHPGYGLAACDEWMCAAYMGEPVKVAMPHAISAVRFLHNDPP